MNTGVLRPFTFVIFVVNGFCTSLPFHCLAENVPKLESVTSSPSCTACRIVFRKSSMTLSAVRYGMSSFEIWFAISRFVKLLRLPPGFRLSVCRKLENSVEVNLNVSSDIAKLVHLCTSFHTKCPTQNLASGCVLVTMVVEQVSVQ